MAAKRRAVSASRIKRTVRPAALAARTATRWAGTYASWGDGRTAKREQFVMRTSEDVTRTLGEMKGAVMKVGQVLSMMTGMVPDEMAGHLATLQSNAPPMAFPLVASVFEAEYGRGPERIFKRFEREPFAAASIGQVHRAELADGTRLAVKVQYPGVREAIDSDLKNVGVIFTMAGAVSKGLDAGPIIEDLKKGIRGELDYVREATFQRRFETLYEGHPFVRVPHVYPDLSTGRVLVQEFIDGKPFATALDLPQPERNRVAEIVFRFSFGNIYQHLLFNGDPHPGNYLLCDDGRVAFLDYGCIAEFEPQAVEDLKDLLRALYEGDLERWRSAAETVGILRRDAPFQTAEIYEHMRWFWAPVLEPEVTFTKALAAEMVRRNTATGGVEGRINRLSLNIPPGMAFLTRINFGLAGLFASLEARGPWRAICGEYLYGTEPTTELGRASRAAAAGRPAI